MLQLYLIMCISHPFRIFIYMAKLVRQTHNKTRASLPEDHVEGQVCVTTDMFRSPVSRRRPSSCTISGVCLPWNVTSDSDSSLEQQGIIWKGWQNQHTVCPLSPLLFGGLLAPLCVHSIKDPVWDVGLKGGDAQFNQTFGCLSVKMPQFQRNDRLRKTMWWNYPLWCEETSDPWMCACFIFFKDCALRNLCCDAVGWNAAWNISRSTEKIKILSAITENC